MHRCKIRLQQSVKPQSIFAVPSIVCFTFYSSILSYRSSTRYIVLYVPVKLMPQAHQAFNCYVFIRLTQPKVYRTCLKVTINRLLVSIHPLSGVFTQPPMSKFTCRFHNKHHTTLSGKGTCQA